MDVGRGPHKSLTLKRIAPLMLTVITLFHDDDSRQADLSLFGAKASKTKQVIPITGRVSC